MSAPSSTPAPPKRFLTPYEKSVLKRDAQALRKVMDDPDATQESRKNSAAALRRTEDNLAANSAPYLTPPERDRIHKRTLELEEKLKVGLLSNQEMRRNPHGAVRANLDYEIKNKHTITRWRNGIRALNPDAPQHVLTDLCSLERIRPRTSSMSMLDCQIPQTKSFSFADEQFKANYDAIDWQMGAQTAPVRVDPRAELMSQFDEDEPAPAGRTAEEGDFKQWGDEGIKKVTVTADPNAVVLKGPDFIPPAPPKGPNQPVQNQKHPQQRR